MDRMREERKRDMVEDVQKNMDEILEANYKQLGVGVVILEEKQTCEWTLTPNGMKKNMKKKRDVYDSINGEKKVKRKKGSSRKRCIWKSKSINSLDSTEKKVKIKEN